MKKILLIKHGSLGDIISSTAVIKDINNHFKKEKIYILTSSKYHNFFKGSDLINEFIIDDRKDLIKTIKILVKILKLKFHIIIDLQNSQRTSLYLLFLRLFSNTTLNGVSIFATNRYKNFLDYKPSVIDGLSNQVELLGINTTRKPYLDWLNKNNFDFNSLSNKIFFLINPGCSKNNNQKRWKAENFAKICSYLVSKNILPILIGSKEDSQSIEIIANSEKNILNLINISPLEIIFQLAKKAKGALSNDTGPAHLIGASGCMLHLVLSNFSNIQTVIPQGKNVTFSQKPSIDDLSVDEVIKDLEKIFKI